MVIFPFISQFDPFMWIYFSILLLNCLLANRPHVPQFLLWERIFFFNISVQVQYLFSLPPPEKIETLLQRWEGRRAFLKRLDAFVRTCGLWIDV